MPIDKPKQKAMFNYAKYKSLNISKTKSNNEDTMRNKFGYRNSLNDKDVISTQTNTVESFYQPIPPHKANSKQSGKQLLRYQTFSNKTNKKKDSNHNIVSLDKTKSIKRKHNLFAIDPEDQIFNMLNTRKKTKKKKKKVKKEKQRPLTYYEIKLKEVYQISNATQEKINRIKMQKKHCTLSEYQSNLIDLTRNTLSMNLTTKLERSLRNIRLYCSKTYTNNYDSLNELEEIEKRIINKANFQNNAIANIINRTEGRNVCDKLVLPEIKYTKVIFRPQTKSNKVE